MQTVVDTYRGFEIVSNGQPGKGFALKRNGTTETGYIYSSVDEARGDIDATWTSIRATFPGNLTFFK